jgi:hypothetical protein
MSCWRRTTVLRIPAIALGFVYFWEWEQFLEKHEEDFNWEPGYFAEAMCDSYEYDEHGNVIKTTCKIPGSTVSDDVMESTYKLVYLPYEYSEVEWTKICDSTQCWDSTRW